MMRWMCSDAQMQEQSIEVRSSQRWICDAGLDWQKSTEPPIWKEVVGYDDGLRTSSARLAGPP